MACVHLVWPCLALRNELEHIIDFSFLAGVLLSCVLEGTAR